MGGSGESVGCGLAGGEARGGVGMGVRCGGGGGGARSQGDAARGKLRVALKPIRL